MKTNPFQLVAIVYDDPRKPLPIDGLPIDDPLIVSFSNMTDYHSFEKDIYQIARLHDHNIIIRCFKLVEI